MNVLWNELLSRTHFALVCENGFGNQYGIRLDNLFAVIIAVIH
jgi:hypothetical protein